MIKLKRLSGERDFTEISRTLTEKGKTIKYELLAGELIAESSFLTGCKSCLIIDHEIEGVGCLYWNKPGDIAPAGIIGYFV